MSGVSKVVFGNQTLIDLTGDTVVAEKLLQGHTAHAANGDLIVGTLPNISPTLITKTIRSNGVYNASDDDADGYSQINVIVHSGDVYVTTIDGSIQNRDVDLLSQKMYTEFIYDFDKLPYYMIDDQGILRIPGDYYSELYSEIIFDGTNFIENEDIFNADDYLQRGSDHISLYFRGITGITYIQLDEPYLLRYDEIADKWLSSEDEDDISEAITMTGIPISEVYTGVTYNSCTYLFIQNQTDSHITDLYKYDGSSDYVEYLMTIQEMGPGTDFLSNIFMYNNIPHIFYTDASHTTYYLGKIENDALVVVSDSESDMNFPPAQCILYHKHFTIINNSIYAFDVNDIYYVYDGNSWSTYNYEDSDGHTYDYNNEFSYDNGYVCETFGNNTYMMSLKVKDAFVYIWYEENGNHYWKKYYTQGYVAA